VTESRTAIVTGAASGIGRGVAARLLHSGYRVALADVDGNGAERARAELDSAGGIATAVEVDVADGARVDAAVHHVLDRFARIDLLCNNAGIMDQFYGAATLPDEVWNRVLAVNVTGPFLMTRAVLPVMLDQGAGSIVNVVSVAGLVGGRAGAAYTASKHGLVGFTRSVAWQYGPSGVRCNGVCPGPVETGIPGGRGHADPDGLARAAGLLATVPRRGSPDEIARVVEFLGSEEASFVNGSIVAVDGGWTSG
jgi:NAD(P)-dependent dehydrogenase (short-subunit alcohol dehydrogenase family)